MTVHYCDRCKRKETKLYEHRIPDQTKPHSYNYYSTKELELCGDCEALVKASEERFLNALLDMKFAFYEAIMTKSEDTE